MLNLPDALLPLLRTIAAEAEQAGSGSALPFPLHGVYLVGGFVRDALLGLPCLDLDVVVEGDAPALARHFLARYGGSLTGHAPFGTATWTPPPIPPFTGVDPIDFATARTETYARPAALPTVTPLPERGALAADVRRRDFTINTLAVQLAPSDRFGVLIDQLGGLSDLRAGLIRVLHDRSFIDDPTRLFRAVRFEQRFGFRIAPETEALITSALAFLPALSGERVRHEYDLILNEVAPENALNRLQTLDILRVNKLRFDESSARAFAGVRELIRAPLWPLPPVLDRAGVHWVILASLLDNPRPLVTELALNRTQAARIAEGERLRALAADSWAALRRDVPRSVLASRLDKLSDEALIAGWALAESSEVREKFVLYARELREITPRINGNDLRLMGLSPGPLFGKLLTRLREAWLDGMVTTSEQEQAFLKRLIDEYRERNDGH